MGGPRGADEYNFSVRRCLWPEATGCVDDDDGTNKPKQKGTSQVFKN